jgi:hypothetical protein
MRGRKIHIPRVEACETNVKDYSFSDMKKEVDC